MTKRILVYLVGLYIVGLGISFIIMAQLGTGPWDALFVGLHWTYPILSIGSFVIIINLILVGVNSFLVNEKPEWLAIIPIVLIGISIDSWLFLLENLYTEFLAFQIMKLIVGIILLGLGIALYLTTKLPKYQIDSLMFSLHKRFNWSLRLSRTVGEVVAIFIALLVKGPVGIGTLVILLTIGPVIQFFNRLFTKKASDCW